MNVHRGLIIIEDKGALDCVIRARLQSALMRAADDQTINWGAEMSKLRRSMLFLPGANAAMLSTAFIYRPDSIMFDPKMLLPCARKTPRACWCSTRYSTRCIRISKPWCALTR